MTRDWRYSVFIIAFIFLALETLLRIFGINNTYLESIGKSYYSYWNKKHDGWYHSGTPNKTYTEKNIDFEYVNTLNSLGHRELEPGQVFSGNQKKVIAIGDSYTEGVGVVYDSSFVRHLERLAQAQGASLAFYNAGVSGMDPFYAYTMVRDKLVRYRPDIVIATFNTSDYTDYVYRGGFNRFRTDSTTVFRKAPMSEPLYRYSYTYRLLLHDLLGYANGDLFMTEKEFMKVSADINRQFVTVADSFQSLAEKNHFQLLFVIHTGCPELIYDSEINRFSRNILEQLNKELKARGYFSVNLWEPMAEVIHQDNRLLYGFEHDGHFSSAGYRLMAQAIWNETGKYCTGFWTTGSTQSSEITPE